MPYIQRDQDGQIIGLSNLPQVGFPVEELPEDDLELLAFIHRKPLRERLKLILLQLPDETQAQFGIVAAAIDLALQNGKPNVAKLELEALTLPAELESVRAQMLEEIENG